MQKMLPITIFTGFLGAGKSTLLNNVLKRRNGKKLAIIVNEFGDVGIDHQLLIPIEEEIYEVSEGCICCTVREDLVNVLYNITRLIQEGKVELDGVIIETTGIADVSAIIQTLTQIPIIANYYNIDAVITVVDAINIPTQLAGFIEAQHQIAYSDKVIMTKTDIATPEQIAVTLAAIKDIQPFVPVEKFADETFKFADVVGTKLFENIVESIQSSEKVHHGHEHDADCDCGCHNHEHDANYDCDCHNHEHGAGCDCGCHDHHHEVQTFAIETTKKVLMERFDEWLMWILDTCQMDLLRYKGIICFADSEEEMVLQGVMLNATIDTSYKKITATSKTTIVFIGKDLPEVEIREKFEKVAI